MLKQSPFSKKMNLYVSRAIIVSVIALCAALYAVVASKQFKVGDFLLSKASAAGITVFAQSEKAPTFVEVATTEELLALFDKHDYALDLSLADDLAQKEPLEVPAIFLAALPKDFAKTLTIQAKKSLFLRTLLPLILEANASIEAERAEILEIQKSLNNMTKAQKARLFELAEKYRCPRFKVADITDLLRKIDVIPVAMALAQGAEETGWFVSSAARNLNATHGVTLPSGVKAYESLAVSVNAYMRNLNANPAYKKMRDIRACLRDSNQELCGIKMMDGLYHYSELRHTYIRKVKNHIRHNKLDRFDDYQLASYNPDIETKFPQES